MNTDPAGRRRRLTAAAPGAFLRGAKLLLTAGIAQIQQFFCRNDFTMFFGKLHGHFLNYLAHFFRRYLSCNVAALIKPLGVTFGIIRPLTD